jgi:hypothetical protein
VKRAIKPFKMDVNQMTGISNFSEISPDPLKLPDYALECDSIHQSQI